MKIIAKAVMSLVAMSLSAATITVLASEPGIKIEHLGTNNTIVRVDSDSKYLLLPVQESIDDATVKIIVDGKLERTLAVRMAKSKWTIPCLSTLPLIKDTTSSLMWSPPKAAHR